MTDGAAHCTRGRRPCRTGRRRPGVHVRFVILLLAAQTGWALGDIEDFSVEELTKWLESLRRVQPQRP